MKTIIKIHQKIIITAIIIAGLFLNTQIVLSQDYAIKLNGDSYVDLDNTNFNYSEELTVMLEARWTIDPVEGNNWANLVTINSETQSDRGQFWIQHNQTNQYFEFALATTQNQNSNNHNRTHIFSTTSPVKDQWYHIAVTYDGNQMKIYVDGVLENTQNKTGLIYHNQDVFKLTFGAWAYQGNRKFNGNMNNVSIWNRALDTNEIINAINNGISDFSDDNLLAFWSFDNVNNPLEESTGNIETGIVLGESGTELEPETIEVLGEDLLPITLSSFNANSNNNSILLNWSTASEINNDFFTIERSSDMSSWEIIGTVNGAGNSNTKLNYQFIDNNPLSGTTYYRLKQTDYDNAFEYFKAVAVNFIADNSIQISLEAYPNPSTGSFNINFYNEYNNTEIKVINSLGQVVEYFNNFNNGENNIYISGLSKGNYFVIVLDNNKILDSKMMIVF